LHDLLSQQQVSLLKLVVGEGGKGSRCHDSATKGRQDRADATEGAGGVRARWKDA
jgi:hypothetical protein